MADNHDEYWLGGCKWHIEKGCFTSHCYNHVPRARRRHMKGQHLFVTLIPHTAADISKLPKNKFLISVAQHRLPHLAGCEMDRFWWQAERTVVVQYSVVHPQSLGESISTTNVHLDRQCGCYRNSCGLLFRCPIVWPMSIVHKQRWEPVPQSLAKPLQ